MGLFTFFFIVIAAIFLFFFFLFLVGIGDLIKAKRLENELKNEELDFLIPGRKEKRESEKK